MMMMELVDSVASVDRLAFVALVVAVVAWEVDHDIEGHNQPLVAMSSFPVVVDLASSHMLVCGVDPVVDNLVAVQRHYIPPVAVLVEHSRIVGAVGMHCSREVVVVVAVVAVQHYELPPFHLAPQLPMFVVDHFLAAHHTSHVHLPSEDDDIHQELQLQIVDQGAWDAVQLLLFLALQHIAFEVEQHILYHLCGRTRFHVLRDRMLPVEEKILHGRRLVVVVVVLLAPT